MMVIPAALRIGAAWATATEQDGPMTATTRGSPTTVSAAAVPPSAVQRESIPAPIETGLPLIGPKSSTAIIIALNVGDGVPACVARTARPRMWIASPFSTLTSPNPCSDPNSSQADIKRIIATAAAMAQSPYPTRPYGWIALNIQFPQLVVVLPERLRPPKHPEV